MWVQRSQARTPGLVDTLEGNSISLITFVSSRAYEQVGYKTTQRETLAVPDGEENDEDCQD